jgi:23S rRNA (uracil1939-C5)-methyltransferase
MPIVTIEWLSPDGTGGGRGEGGTFRVPGALPGDRVEVRERQRHGKTVDAEIVAFVAESPLRRAPPCPFDAGCGGCDLSALVPGERAAILGHIAQRALGLPQRAPVVESPRPLGHRARIKLAIGDRIGFRSERSHEIVAVDRCLAARPEVDAALARVQEIGPRPGLSSVELRSDGSRVVFAFEGDASLPDATFEAIKSLGDVALNGRRVAGDPVLRIEVLGVRLRASPASFYQVNLEVNARLAAHVSELVVGARAERVVDLYGGIGNLGLPIAATGVPVLSVEQAGSAAADGAATAKEQGLRWTGVTGDVGRWDPSREAFDVAVLDPPRAGAPGVIDRLIRNRPRTIVYVSCNVPAAARDLRPALSAGYRITEARVFDMFPDTRHFETVIALSR